MQGNFFVRGFDMVTRAPRPLFPHLHLAACKLPRSPNSAATEQSADSARASVVNDLLPPDDVPDEAPEEGARRCQKQGPPERIHSLLG
jgi:hypothetical protein